MAETQRFDVIVVGALLALSNIDNAARNVSVWLWESWGFPDE